MEAFRIETIKNSVEEILYRDYLAVKNHQSVLYSFIIKNTYWIHRSFYYRFKFFQKIEGKDNKYPDLEKDYSWG